jgi:hypothetical protein
VPASEQVEMHMKHRLPSIAVAIEHQSIPLFRVAAIPCHVSGDKEQLSNARGISRREIVQRLHVLERNKEQMDGRLRPDVMETENLIVPVNDSRRELTIPDFAERAAAHAPSSLEALKAVATDSGCP